METDTNGDGHHEAESTELARSESYARQQRSLEVAKAQQIAKAIEFRSEGMTYAEIGELMEISGGQAAALIKAGLQQIVREPAEELRTLEALRLEKMWRIAWPKSQVEHFRGPFGAMDTQGEWFDRCIKLMERRARLLGLDAAQEISFPELRAALFAVLRDQMPPEEYQKMIALIAE